MVENSTFQNEEEQFLWKNTNDLPDGVPSMDSLFL